VAHDVSTLSSTDLPPLVEQRQSFAIVVADHFDLNIGTLHGENSIHILNRIIVQTPLNDESESKVKECLNDLCASVVSCIDSSVFDPAVDSTTSNSTVPASTNTTVISKPYSPFTNDSYRDALLAYSMMKHAYDTNNIFEGIVGKRVHVNLPLLSGFFATYLPHTQRPLSTITFLPPIIEDLSSLATSQLCLQSAKAASIDSGYQREVVVVVDEKIYSNCAKVRSLSTVSFKRAKSRLSS
jgi:hypothetical protein